MELDTFILDLFSMRIVYVMATHRSPVSTASEHVLWGKLSCFALKHNTVKANVWIYFHPKYVWSWTPLS